VDALHQQENIKEEEKVSTPIRTRMAHFDE
jgi:hypothetical protein